LLDNDPAAISLVRKIENVFTSIVVVGELYYAAANSSKRETNFKNFQEALSCLEIIPIDDAVCMSYAEIKLELKKKGRPIPDNERRRNRCASGQDQ